ncbi:MAG: 6-phosphogluconolactonase [Gemmataceae bacterium]
MPAVIQTFTDADGLCQFAADLLAQHAAQTAEAWDRFTLALSGGSTPRRLFQILAQDPYRDGLPWEKVQLFWGDERCVPPDHADSNYGMARHELLRHIRIPKDNVHRMEADRADLDVAACDYQKDIAAALGVHPFEPPPALDFVLLGMGPDGHTASLFPHTQALQPTVHWVTPNFVPKFNANRMTMTPALLNKAKTICFLVTGAEKASVLKEVLEGPRDPERLPSQLIQPENGNLLWLLDEAAASLLS